jgi:hypothetical protein
MKACETIGFVVGVLLAAGCSRSATDSPRDAGAARAPSAGSWATNWSEITRFQDEVPFGPLAKVRHDGTAVRQAPDDDNVVATLASGTNVLKISRRGDDDLIGFNDPKGNGQRLVGWVPVSALEEGDSTPDDAGDEDADEPATGPTEPSPGPAPRHHHHRPHKAPSP